MPPAMPRHPVMNLGSTNPSGHAHVGNHAQQFTRPERPHAISARLAAHDRVATALQSGADVFRHGPAHLQ